MYWLTTICYLFALEEYISNLFLFATGANLAWLDWVGLLFGAGYWLWRPFFGFPETNGFFTEERFPTKKRVIVFGFGFIVAGILRFIN